MLVSSSNQKYAARVSLQAGCVHFSCVQGRSGEHRDAIGLCWQVQRAQRGLVSSVWRCTKHGCWQVPAFPRLAGGTEREDSHVCWPMPTGKAPDWGGPALLTCFSLGGTWNCEVVALIIATSRSCSMHPALKASSPAQGFPSVAYRRLLPDVHPELPVMSLYVSCHY